MEMRIINNLTIKILVVFRIENRKRDKIDVERDKALNRENHVCVYLMIY